MRGWRCGGTWIDERHLDKRLSEYLDGELDNAERVALEAHLATCGQCYATLGELRQVIARAQALQDTPPAANYGPRFGLG
jgi:anti-sigma factor RsiW